MSEWEVQVKQIQNSLDEIKREIKENKKEIVELKEELATGKGAIKAVAFVGLILTIVWTTFKMLTYK